MTGFSGFVSGMMNGYRFVKDMKNEDERKERQKQIDALTMKDTESRIADREASRDASRAKAQRENEYANSAAQIIGREGTVQTTADAGGGYKFKGADAGQRATEFASEAADPEFGIDAQARMSNPNAASAGINATPKITNETYSKAQANQDLSAAALKAGNTDQALKFRQAAELAKSEGLDGALAMLESGNIKGAIDTYNKSGADRVQDIRDLGKGRYEVIGVDGSVTQVDPKQMRRSLLSMQDQSKLSVDDSRIRANDALANNRSYMKLGDGQDLVTIGEDGTPRRTIENPKSFNPNVGKGGGGSGGGSSRGTGGTGSQDRLNLQRAESLRKSIADVNKDLNNITARMTPEERKAKLALRDQYMTEYNGLAIKTQNGSPGPTGKTNPDYEEYTAAYQQAYNKGGQALADKVTERARKEGIVK